MTPLEVLYGRKCRWSCCTEVGDAKIAGLAIVMETIEKIKVIQDRLNIAQDQQKSYADVNKRKLGFLGRRLGILENITN